MDRKLIVMIVAPLALAAGLLLAGWYMNYSMGPTIEQDRTQYQAFMAKWPFPELTGHFPQTLPQDAQDVRMILDPGGIQGAARMELQMQLPQPAIDDLLRQHGLLPAAIPTTQAAAPRSPVRPDPEALRRVRITSADYHPVPISPEHRVIEFFAYSEDGDFVHGRIYGTAANPATRQIIYFAQTW